MDATQELLEPYRIEDGCRLDSNVYGTTLLNTKLSNVTQQSRLTYSAAAKRSGVSEFKTFAESKLGKNTRKHAEVIYQRIKSRLLQQSLAPGQLLQIGRLATELRTSSTPVREALIRLATERVIAYTPGKGFFTKVSTQDELRELYLVNQMYILGAITYWPKQFDQSLQVMRPPGVMDVTVARAARADFDMPGLFLWMAGLTGVDELVSVIANINDRLHLPRIAEDLAIVGVQEEQAVLSALLPTVQPERLGEAIRQYHEVRLRQLPQIYKELLSRSYAKS